MAKKDNTPVTKDDVKQIVTESVGELAVIIKKSFDGMYKHVDNTVQKSAQETQRKFDDVYEYIDKSAEETQRHFDVVAKTFTLMWLAPTKTK